VRCAGRARWPPPFDALTPEVVPARASVRAGERVDLAVAIVNTTANAIDFDLDMSCGDSFQVHVTTACGNGAARRRR
jgi:hypothetical protein